MSPRRARTTGLLLLLGMLFGLYLTPLVGELDFRLLDLEQRLLRGWFARPATYAVVVVGITDETTDRFPEPMTLWHPHLGAFLDAMADAHPGVVGLDLVLPHRSYDTLLPGNDLTLFRGMLAVRQAGVPLVIAQGTDRAGRPRPIFPGITGLLADRDAVGLVALGTERDQVIRRFVAHLQTDDGLSRPTLAAAIAAKVGAQPGSGLIDYTFGEPFSFIPFEQVLEWRQQGDHARLQQAFQGKAVLLGAVFPFEDRHELPVPLATWEPDNRVVPGVLAQAQILRNHLDGRSLTPLADGLKLLLLTLTLPLWWLGARGVIGLAALAGFLLLIPLLSLAALTHGWVLPTATLLIGAIIAGSGRMSLESFIQLQEKRRLQHTFGRYVSPTVVEQLIEGKIRPGIGGEARELCVLFCDIRNFTTRSESQPPQTTIALLNRYFTEMTAAIHNHGGTVDKFIGDGMMAFFGAPNRLANPSAAAFDAAREMLERLRDLNRTLVAEGIEPILIGVGLNSGSAVVGNVGAENRHEYTAIGDAVNVASRLEGLSKPLGYPVIISAATRDQLSEKTGFAELGPQPVKGHSPVQVYGWRPASESIAGEIHESDNVV